MTNNQRQQLKSMTGGPSRRSVPEGGVRGISRTKAEYMGGNGGDGQVIDHGWPDLPARIAGKPAPPDLYPVDVFPRELSEVIPAVQRLAQCPAAIAGAALLGALALLVQHDWRVQTLAPHPSPAGLYLVAIAESGLHKSTAFGLMADGHQQADILMESRWNEAVQRGAVKEECEGRMLRSSLPVALLSEFTTDGMLRQLQDGRPAVASWEAEAGTLINLSFHGNRSPRTMGYLNKGWEGAALFKTLADGQAGIYVPQGSYALSIVWAGAPAVMLPVIFGRDAAHGFTARCLVSKDSELVDPGDPLEGDGDLVQLFNDVVFRVRERQDHGMEYAPAAGESRRRDRLVRLSTAARDLLKDFYSDRRSLASRWRHNGQNHEAAFAERAPEHAARIAGVWTAWEAYRAAGPAPDELCSDAGTVERAILLVDWYLGEVVRLAPVGGVTLKAACAEHLAAMIAKVIANPASRQGEPPLLNDHGVLVNSVASGWGRRELRGNPDLRREVTKVLVDHGHIRPSGFKGRYEPHPRLGEMYASF